MFLTNGQNEVHKLWYSFKLKATALNH